MFVRDCAVTPGPSRECDITTFVKRRPKIARQSRDSTVAARRVQSVTVPSSRVSRECRSDIFYFSARGSEKGSPRTSGKGAGDDFLLKIPGGGGSPAWWGWGGEGPAGCLRGIGGGGPKYFFSGPKFPPSKVCQRIPACPCMAKIGKYRPKSAKLGKS